MKARLILVGLAAMILLLAGCTKEESQNSDPVSLIDPTVVAPTPTLLPGLPTSTPWSGEVAESQRATPTLPAPPPPPTATPAPVERLELAQSFLEDENYVAAAEQYQAGLASEELSDSQQQEALLGLGRARMAEGQFSAADEAFGRLLANHSSSAELETPASAVAVSAQAASAYFLQAQSYEAQANCPAAIGAYREYLELDDTLAAYIQPLIADCYLSVEDHDQALEALEAAITADALPDLNVSLRFRLAQLYQDAGDYEAALAQYETVLTTAKDENTLGRATYLAGSAELLAGNTEAAYVRYLEGVERYPRAYESYQGLVALVEAGYEVDDFQRGVVDYYAKAHEAAVSVLTGYLETATEHNEDAHLYLAWSLEALGNVPAALEQIEAYIEAQAPSVVPESTPTSLTPEVMTGTPTVTEGLSIAAAARGTVEKGKMQARAGFLNDSAETYAQYVAQYPEQEDGPYAAWWSAAITEQLGDSTEAVGRYQLLAELYPEHEDADEALFRAGYLAHLSGDSELARTLWEQAATSYPDKHYGAAALVWLLRTLREDEQEVWLEQAAETSGSTYYLLRAQDIANGVAPFEEPVSRNLEFSTRDQQAAESWLRRQLDLPEDVDVSSEPEMLATDGRLARGKALWQLGLRQEAKSELESLRREYAGDPLASYQLALIFRDLGLYRSSILSAESTLKELEVDVLESPRFLAGLAYPTYYADLIIAEAEAYDYDPLLQFALVRQESLFESFATSGAAAQGLSQVIPDTGAYIAQRLGLQDYVNEDLYRPYIGIAFGAFYLDQQLSAFDGDVAAALSAYNAGPGNAARWYEEAGGDIDLYVVTVDFSETQHYIERIYAGHAIYRHIYGGDGP